MAFLRLPEGTADIVRAGGGPLTVDAVEYGDDGIATGVLVSVVVFLDEGRLRSIAEADYLAEQARVDADREAASQLRTQILQAAQSAVGVRLNDLTAAQRNSLIALVLWKEGGVKNDATIAPLGEWLR
jgi:hypothetical protein